jgi:hypothetical protein
VINQQLSKVGQRDLTSTNGLEPQPLRYDGTILLPTSAQRACAKMHKRTQKPMGNYQLSVTLGDIS